METAEHTLTAQCLLGEGPLWHVEEQALYWVDILQAQVHRYCPEEQEYRVFQLNTAITALGRRAGGGFIAACLKSFARWSPEDGEPRPLVELERDQVHHRFNDGQVDRQGRFWAGTMYAGPELEPPPPGTLYRLDPDGSARPMETGLLLSNGIGWSPDSRRMYLTDSRRKRIYTYDFDAATGAIENRRVFAATPDEMGVPDGLAVDSQGFLWSARWGGWKIQRYDPDGRLEREIAVPVECPSSCAFGGPGLSDLYVTSARQALGDRQRAEQPLAGDLFRLHAGIRGLPAPLFSG